ncbi:hypothetical protein [Vibrio mediterranei]|uniref:hypothetical protein n=1 Tax=Vibrio mediterranei TaxID=689 RepID=UPI004068157B
MTLAEASAVVHLLNIKGFNALSLSRKNPQWTDFVIRSSQPLLVNLMGKHLPDSKSVATLKKNLEPLKAFCMGAYVVENLEPEHNEGDYIKVSIGDILHGIAVSSIAGEVRLTSRAIEEYLSLPLSRDLVEIRNEHFGRPYDTIGKVISSAREILPENNKHVTRLKSKFGAGAISLMNDDGVATIVDLVPIKSPGSKRYIVIGFRQLYSKALQKRLLAKGLLPSSYYGKA